MKTSSCQVVGRKCNNEKIFMPHCYGRGGYYMPIWGDNGEKIGEKWYGCFFCKDGRVRKL